MAQWLRVCAALAEDTGSVPSTYIRWLIGESGALCWPSWAQTQRKTHLYAYFKNKRFKKQDDTLPRRGGKQNQNT